VTSSLENHCARLLLVDDDEAFRKVYRGLLASEGHEVVEADDRKSARAAFEAEAFDAVLLDLMLPPDGSAKKGLEELSYLLTLRPTAKIIVVSGVGDVPHMVQAVRRGAYDFLTKPVEPDVLLIVVQRAVARARLELQVEALRSVVTQRQPAGTMLGRSPKFLETIRLAERVATSELPVLITGETGTGKELMARLVHEQSPRAAKPFVAVNCGALNEGLLESTLFGHAKGAFTSAVNERNGLFVQADGGTLFLDEIGDMPPRMQVELLRVLETGEVMPVGKDTTVRVNVRLVSATHHDLDELRAEGAFRDDLYWRIRGSELPLPPLRERPSDIPLLAAHFLEQCASLSPDGRAKRMSEEAASRLSEHDWPGNLRELKHRMQQATVLAGARAEVVVEDLGLEVSAPRPVKATLQEKVEALERREIEATLAQHHGNRSRTAETLGLSRQGLLNKMSRYGLG
jgi:DNA-binding NtrC family response regulator